MEQNYIQKRILNNAIRSDSGLKRTIGWSDKRKTAVLSVMEKQGIKKDINKLAGYKKDAFVKAVTDITGIGHETKKAIHCAFDAKMETPKNQNDKRDAGTSMKKTYDEIMSKRSGFSQAKNAMPTAGENKMPSKNSNFGASDQGLRKAADLFVKPKENFHPLYGTLQKDSDEKENIKSRLDELQN